MTRHTCHARGCETPTPRRMFMCKKHWYMLTKAERDSVWAAYVPGQEEDPSMVTDGYLATTTRIIDALASREAEA